MVMTIQYRHIQFEEATSAIQRGSHMADIMTIWVGRKSKSARSISTIYMGQAQQFSLFSEFFFLILDS
jgi:hypothetical protein